MGCAIADQKRRWPEDQDVVVLGTHLLDYDAVTGAVRMRTYVVNGGTLQLSAPVSASKLGTGRQLVDLRFSGRVLDWKPSDSSYHLRKFDFAATGSQNPLPRATKAGSGSFDFIRSAHSLIAAGGFLIDWVHDAGYYRVFRLDFTDPSDLADPIDIAPAPAQVEGFWHTIAAGMRMIAVSDGILVWSEADGNDRLWPFFVVPALPS